MIGPELYADYRPLAKDIRALDAARRARAIAAWGICEEVHVLDAAGAVCSPPRARRSCCPAEDVSYQVVERFFPRCEVLYDTVFLRWDKTKSVAAARAAAVPRDEDETRRSPTWPRPQAARSVDWWRQVGAAIRFADGTRRGRRERAPPAPAQPPTRPATRAATSSRACTSSSHRHARGGAR